MKYFWVVSTLLLLGLVVTVQRSNGDKLNNDKLMILHTVRYSQQDIMNKA